MSASNATKSLKSANLPWLVSLVVFDIMIVLPFAYPALINSTSVSQLITARAMVTLALPVVVLLLTGLLPHNIKASLVYWKYADVLPAHEAFTKHALSDARVDMAALRAQVGELPTIPREQNRLWFKLYKATENAPAVLEAHKMYLLYRDMASISFLLLIFVPIAFYLSGFGHAAVLATTGIFALQYLMAAISARHSGVRFVTNVLSIHSMTPATAAFNRPSSRKTA